MRIPRTVRHASVFMAAALAMFIASLTVASPASAHSQLLATSPADGTTLSSPMAEVTLTFNERVRGTFTMVAVNGPLIEGSGTVSYSDGHAQVIDDVVHQKVYPLRSGAYSVAWRTISADGHPVEGLFHFTIALPAGDEPKDGPPTPAATSGQTRGKIGWFLGGVAVVVIGGGVAALMMRRRSGKHQPVEMADE